MEWDWLHMMPEATVKFEPQEDDPELFELVYVVRKKETTRPLCLA